MEDARSAMEAPLSREERWLVLEKPLCWLSPLLYLLFIRLPVLMLLCSMLLLWLLGWLPPYMLWLVDLCRPW